VRRPSLVAFALLALVGTGATAVAEPYRYRIDPEHLSIGFSASHIGYADVLGLFLRGAGSFVYDAQTRTLRDLQATVDPASVFTNHRARDEHLRSGEFLDAAAHPEIRFVMTGAEPTGERTGKVTGDLTLRGVTRPVVLDVTLNAAKPSPLDGSERLGVSVRTTIQRSAWGMTYAVENGWVADAIPLSIEFEAVREPGPVQ
jgi:polyisoprenoid-binding protein YceI